MDETKSQLKRVNSELDGKRARAQDVRAAEVGASAAGPAISWHGHAARAECERNPPKLASIDRADEGDYPREQGEAGGRSRGSVSGAGRMSAIFSSTFAVGLVDDVLL